MIAVRHDGVLKEPKMIFARHDGVMKEVGGAKLPMIGETFEGGILSALVRFGGAPFALVAAEAPASRELITPFYDPLSTPSDTDGLANDVAARATSSSFDHVRIPAFHYCWTYAAGGFTDWYLPAPRELQAMMGARGVSPFPLSSNYWSSRVRGFDGDRLTTAGGIETMTGAGILITLPVRRIAL